jgi:diaminohydroxyphosphoribosylaminopyrimidine deaminase/5-amino-6-(5-phosphoribosylamino)uracil reductase
MDDAAFLDRALDLVRADPLRAYPKPTVGTVVVVDGQIVAEGVTEKGGRHGEVVALDQVAGQVGGGTIYVTMEPCAHWGTTPPCTERVLTEGLARVVAASLDPNPEATGGLDYLRSKGVVADEVDCFEARALSEAWRTFIAKRRPFVAYKVATTLDGHVTLPGERWITGEESRRQVHELRARYDAVAVGMGTVRADAPRLDARDVPTPRGQPRRLAFGRGPLPPESELELCSGPLADELTRLAAEGVQSILLEGGPTLAGAFLDAGLVDKLLLYVAPVLNGGDGPTAFPRLGSVARLSNLTVSRIGDDALIEAYVNAP